jgi:Ca2+-binding EF-hand superfamily protein
VPQTDIDGNNYVSKKENFLFVIVVLMFALVAAAARQRASTPKAQDRKALEEGEVKQLLLLMDTDKNGKISKKEYISFMEAESDRLDQDKSGELDPRELAQSRFRVSHPSPSGGR